MVWSEGQKTDVDVCCFLSRLSRLWWCGDTREHFPVRRDASRPCAASSVPLLSSARHDSRPALTLSSVECQPPRPWVGWNYSNVSGRLLPAATPRAAAAAPSWSTDSHCRLFIKSVKQQPNLAPSQYDSTVTQSVVQIKTCDIRIELGDCEFPLPPGSSLSV